MLEALKALGSWIRQHPTEAITIGWVLMNILWAQLPVSWFKNPKANKLLSSIHTVFQFVVTHASLAGTFTWPSILRALLQSFGVSIGPAVPPVPIVFPTRTPSDRPWPMTPSGRPAPMTCTGHPVAMPPAVDAPAPSPIPGPQRTPTLPCEAADISDAETPVDVPHPQHESSPR